MKRVLTTIGLALAVSLAVIGVIYAAATNYTANTSYGRQSTGMTVPGSPVMVMPNAQSSVAGVVQPGRSSFRICNRASSSANVLCWDYSGATPAATAGNAEEIPTGSCHSDGKDLDPVIGLAWACAPESTATAIIDSTWR